MGPGVGPAVGPGVGPGVGHVGPGVGPGSGPRCSLQYRDFSNCFKDFNDCEGLINIQNPQCYFI